MFSTFLPGKLFLFFSPSDRLFIRTLLKPPRPSYGDAALPQLQVKVNVVSVSIVVLVVFVRNDTYKHCAITTKGSRQL